MDFADCLGLAQGMVVPIETHDPGKVQPWQRLQRRCGTVQDARLAHPVLFSRPLLRQDVQAGSGPSHASTGNAPPLPKPVPSRWRSQRGRSGRSAAESPNIAKRCPSQSAFLWIAEAASHTLVELHCTKGNQHLSSD